MDKVLFLAPHPDDDAIFAGGIIALLRAKGVEVHVVFATNGGLGKKFRHRLKNVPLENVRKKEARKALAILGVDQDHCHFLGYKDSGMHPNKISEDSFAKLNTALLAKEIADMIDILKINEFVCDDPNGIYGHPDHVKCNEVGTYVKTLCPDLGLNYVTIDREQSHFLHTKHVVQQALTDFLKIQLSRYERTVQRLKEFFGNDTVALNQLEHFGTVTVEITYPIDVSSVINQKKDALIAHGSQISPKSIPVTQQEEAFSLVFGTEYIVRVGEVRKTPFDDLPQHSMFR